MEKSKQIDENKIGKGSNKEKSVEDADIVGKIKKNIDEWSVKKLIFELSSGVKGKRDCLVHDLAKVNISELGTLIYPVEIFTDSERKELSGVLNDSFLVSFVSSWKNEEDVLNISNYHSISLSTNLTFDDDSQQNDKRKNGLVVFGVVFVSVIAGLAIVKRKFIRRK